MQWLRLKLQDDQGTKLPKAIEPLVLQDSLLQHALNMQPTLRVSL